jgi:hypothetical protein
MVDSANDTSRGYVSHEAFVWLSVIRNVGRPKSKLGALPDAWTSPVITPDAARIGSRLRFRPDDPYYRLSDRDRDRYRVDKT